MKMESDENVQIVVENEKFSFRKKDLVDSSDFFNAMFSGRYAESRQKCIFLKGTFNQLSYLTRFRTDNKRSVRDLLRLPLFRALPRRFQISRFADSGSLPRRSFPPLPRFPWRSYG